MRQCRPPGSGDKPEPLRVGESGEDRAGVGDSQMAAHDFGEYAAEVGGDGEVPPVVALFAREPGPAPVDLPAADVLSTDDHHGVAVAMVGAAVAVLGDGPSKLAHRQNDDVGHAIAEVPREGREAAREIVEAPRKLAGGGSLVHVRVPAARLGEGNLETYVRLDQLRDLPERVAVAGPGVVGAVLGLILRRIG